ncbi:hypothetical protein, partial [Rhodopirellula bahusiensis]
MPARLSRRHRLHSEVYEMLYGEQRESGQAPVMEKFCQFVRDAKNASVGADDQSRLVSRRVIPESLARLYSEYFYSCGRLIHPTLWEKLFATDGGGESESFQKMFEEVSEAARFVKNDVQSDPLFADAKYDVGPLVTASSYILDSLAKLFYYDHSGASFFDMDSGPEAYARHIYEYIGFADGSKTEELTADEAFMKGVAFMFGTEGEEQSTGPWDGGWRREIHEARRLISKNPNFLRWSLDAKGNRLGATCAHPISERAFLRATQGSWDDHRVPDEDISPRGNIIFLHSYFERITPGLRAAKAFWQRKTIYASFLHQLALLINPDKREMIRAVAISFRPEDTARMEKMGFVVTGHFSEPSGQENGILV